MTDSELQNFPYPSIRVRMLFDDGVVFLKEYESWRDMRGTHDPLEKLAAELDQIFLKFPNDQVFRRPKDIKSITWEYVRD